MHGSQWSSGRATRQQASELRTSALCLTIRLTPADGGHTLGRMASSPGPQPYLVTVPDLIGLSPQQARDFARRAQLIAVGPDPDARPPMDGVVSGQSPASGSLAARWSSVVIWTIRRGGGPGDAGVREPRNPSPPPLAVSVHDPEPLPEPPMGHVAVEQLEEPAAE
jgi:hypothetical protein